MSVDPEISVELRQTIQLTVFVGLGVIIFALFLKWIRQKDSSAGSGKNDKPEKIKSSSAESSIKHGKKEQASSVKASSKKKLTERESRRNVRTNEKGIKDPWFLISLKGHTGIVLDMDYAANGKYLASCSDEDPDGLSSTAMDVSSSSSSDSNVENSLPSSQNPSPTMPKGLSRRQRKNRKLSKDNQTNTKKTSPNTKKTSKNSNSPGLPDNSCHLIAECDHRRLVFTSFEPLAEYKNMLISEEIFASLLRNYSLDQASMSTLGYPTRKPHLPSMTFVPTAQMVYYQAARMNNTSYLDVHAEEFVPRQENERDSGNGSEASGNSSEEETSSNSSDASEDLPVQRRKLAPGTIKLKDMHHRLCVRCGRYFCTTSKVYITTETCSYHWGKLRTENSHGYGPMLYTCCGGTRGTPGCSRANLHVWNGPSELFVNSTFVETEPPKGKQGKGHCGVYSLDCEMSYTVAGLEAVKVTIVDMTGKPVYNEYVKPKNDIVDFNTRFSGISEEDFIRNNPKSLAQVQRDLKKFISSETIVIGHGLENDFKALRMIHKTIVDTAYTFPHHLGLPYKRSLKSLTKTCLRRDIQCSENGHDSFEDARACMELMLFRVRQDCTF